MLLTSITFCIYNKRYRIVRISRLIFAIIILLVLVSPVQAYFKDLGIGARPLGMGGAYVAAADDGNAVLWNASGLAQLDRQEITAMFSALYAGLGAQLYDEKTDLLGYHFIGYVYPSTWGSFALSWSTFQSRVYDENTFCLSYGRKLREYLYAGLNLKRQGWSVGSNEYTSLDRDIPDHGISKSGFTMDLSALYKAANRFSIGFSAENFLPADVGLDTKENIPVNLRGGVAYRTYRPRELSMNLLSAFDITYRAGDGFNVHTGMECWFLDGMVGARAGWNLRSATAGLSYRVTRGRGEMQIDYAFVYPTSIRETYGSHRMSMSVKF
jgi:hypothetical protein